MKMIMLEIWNVPCRLFVKQMKIFANTRCQPCGRTLRALNHDIKYGRGKRSLSSTADEAPAKLAFLGFNDVHLINPHHTTSKG